MASHWSYLMLGAIAMGSLVAGLVFLRHWRDGRDRFFLLFALSFFVEAANRIALAATLRPNEGSPWFYTIRLVAYGLIVLAILDKNRPRGRSQAD